MINNKELWLSDIARDFIMNNPIDKVYRTDKIVQSETLKNELLNQARENFKLDIDDYKLQTEVTKKVAKYFERDQKKVGSITRNLSNIYNLTTKTERKTIIDIAFALEVTPEKCDALLIAGGLQELHYGGDYIETAIYYCLAFGCSYYDCKEIISDYRKLLSDKEYIANNFSVAPTIYSQVTVFFREKWKDIFDKNKEGKNKSREQIKKEIIARMINLSKNSSSYNRRLQKYLQEVLGKRKTVTVNDFCCFYCKNVDIHEFSNYPAIINQTYDSIKNYFSDFKNLKAKPTRDFICLILIIMYCKDDHKKESMDEYIAEKLMFGYSSDKNKHLDKEKMIDKFIIELSKYDIDSSKIKTSKTIDYINYDGIPVVINRENLPKNLSYLSLMRYIISQYTYPDTNNNQRVHYLYNCVEKLQDADAILEDF